MTKQLTTEDRKQQDLLATDLMRAMIHLEIARTEIEQLNTYRLPKAMKDLSSFSKELHSKLDQANKKIRWFVSVVKKMLGTENSTVLDENLAIDSSRLCNIAQLSGWVVDTPGDLTNDIDLLLSKTRRKELMLRAWKTALGKPELSADEQNRFSSWYNANFIS